MKALSSYTSCVGILTLFTMFFRRCSREASGSCLALALPCSVFSPSLKGSIMGEAFSPLSLSS
jgi:hypothetical protein